VKKIIQCDNGQCTLYSRKKNPKTGKRRVLGRGSREAIKRRERQVQYFKHHEGLDMAGYEKVIPRIQQVIARLAVKGAKYKHAKGTIPQNQIFPVASQIALRLERALRRIAAGGAAIAGGAGIKALISRLKARRERSGRPVTKNISQYMAKYHPELKKYMYEAPRGKEATAIVDKVKGLHDFMDFYTQQKKGYLKWNVFARRYVKDTTLLGRKVATFKGTPYYRPLREVIIGLVERFSSLKKARGRKLS